MTFTPTLPTGGFAGWSFLQRTYDAQRTAFSSSAAIQREVAHFESNIGQHLTAESLVEDRISLKVALGAHGLGDDLNNTYFVKKVLEDGTLDSSALGMRLSDVSYREFSGAFGFGPLEIPGALDANFAKQTSEQYIDMQFEEAIGEQFSEVRLALNLQRELPELATSDLSNDALWYTVMGNPPLREVFETSFGLPSSFGTLDLDQQLTEFRRHSSRVFGDTEITQFTDEAKFEKLTRLYLARAQIESLSQSSLASGQVALALLQS